MEKKQAQYCTGTAIGYVKEVKLIPTKNGSEMLSLKLECGENKDRASLIMFSTRKNPQKAREQSMNVKEGDFIYARGDLEENVFTTKSGNEGIDYQIRIHSFSHAAEHEAPGTLTFNTIGRYIKRKKNVIEFEVNNDYERADGETVKVRNTVHVTVSDELLDDWELDLEKGCLVQGLGAVLNRSSYYESDKEGYNPHMGAMYTKKDNIGRVEPKGELQAVEFGVICDAEEAFELYGGTLDDEADVDMENIPF